MRLNAHFDMLPERAFTKRGFGSAPATLEGGKGGGGGPTQTTAYQTNLPEYAQPYVMNMLGAAQNQLFTTTPGVDGAPGEITGFRGYTPYSSNPQDYFAGPSSLQEQAYSSAGALQTPGQFGQGSELAGSAGSGQLGTAGQAANYGNQGANYGSQGAALGRQGVGIGQTGANLGMMGVTQSAPAFLAGSDYNRQVTTPSEVGAYMSPYQQQVTDIAKASAIRDAQIMEQGNRLSSARQGTYGGARQALASLERERALGTNLANIQAQGSQSAYDRAIQSMQFGSNLGLQGIQTGLQGIQAGQQGLQTGLQGIGQGLAGTAQGMQGAGIGLQGVGAQQAGYAGANQAAATLGQLGSAQQQGNLANLNLQNQLGQQQQAYQQNIINQAIQDYATAQQYPYMQLSTMSNLLRGLPMQGMTTQQYQAQPSMGQQLVGLGGTAAALGRAGVFRKGGQVKSYAGGGGIKASLESRIDDIAETGGIKGLQGILAQTKSPQAKQMIIDRMREEGIAAAPTGSLGRNMAGGGIVAFEAGGDVPGFYEGGDTMGGFAFDSSPDMVPSVSDFSDEEKLDYLRKKGRFGLAQAKDLQEGKVTLNQLFNNSYSPSSTTAAQAKPASPAAAVPPAAPPAPSPKKEVVPPAAPPTTGDGKTGIAKILADQDAALAARGVTPGMGEETRGLMDYIKAGKERRQSEADKDRYLRMAEAFAQFGSTPGPFLSSASKALGGFAKGEAGAQKELRAADLADKKMAADIEKGQRAEARGDYAMAQKAFDSAENRDVQRQGHLKSAEASMYSADREARMIERAMKDPKFLKTMQTIKGNDSVAVQAIKTQLADIAQQIMFAGKDEALKKKLMDQRAALNARLGEISKTGDTTTAAAQEIKVVSTEAEYAKLKKGQQYRDPNGEIRTKG